MITAQIDFGRFEPISQQSTYCLLYRSWGWDKVGKNHFGYTMPGPIFGLYLDPAGTKGVAEKFVRGEVPGFPPRDIFQIQYRFNKKFDDQQKAIELRDRFIEDYHYALHSAKSVQIDETELWELCRFAQFNRESAKGRDYGPLNGMYRGLIQAAADAGVNLQLIQKVKEKYVSRTGPDGKPLVDKWGDQISDKVEGAMVPMGFPQAGNIVQASLEHSWTKEGGFRVRIEKARQNTAVWGEEFSNLTFPELGTLIYPESQESDWQ